MAVPLPARLVTFAVTMNDFQVIGDLIMRTGLRDRQEANIASRYREMYGAKLFLRSKRCVWT